MKFDEKRDALEHIKSFIGVNGRIREFGGEILGSLPSRDYTYKRVMKESGLTNMQGETLPKQTFIPYYKVVLEDGYWVPYMNRNWPQEGSEKWVKASG